MLRSVTHFVYDVVIVVLAVAGVVAAVEERWSAAAGYFVAVAILAAPRAAFVVWKRRPRRARLDIAGRGGPA